MILAAGSPFDPIYNLFGALLAFFYGVVPNLGVCIILLTIVVMLVLFPLTAKQAKAMLAMQRAQPEIKKLQAKYKHDRAKLNEEMMKFYQENKINPLAGCLPVIIQLPIFFALFRVMRTPYQHIPTSSDLYYAFCHKAGHAVSKAQCGKGSLPHHLTFLGMDLSQTATGVKGGVIDALPYFVLVGLVIVTGFLQARQSRRNAPNVNTQMALVTNIMPIGFGIFSLGFPAGLVLYFFVSNLWRLGQQEVIMRKITRPGQVALAANTAIDVTGSEASDEPTAPRPAGGLRKLFQVPTTGNGDTGTKAGGNGATKPKTGQPARPGSGSGSKTGAQSQSGAGGGRAGTSSQRRRNKKRKRR